jgi:hypothetical protein
MLFCVIERCNGYDEEYDVAISRGGWIDRRYSLQLYLTISLICTAQAVGLKRSAACSPSS